MNPFIQSNLQLSDPISRREMIRLGARGFGALGLASILSPEILKGTTGGAAGVLGQPHSTPKAKRAIYLFFSGGPSHIDMYGFKPAIRKTHGIELPESIRMGQRLTGITSG